MFRPMSLAMSRVPGARESERFHDPQMMNCKTCGKSFAVPDGRESAVLVDEESSRCARMRDIDSQRKSIDAARHQSGFDGVLHGTGDTDTVDIVMKRHSMARLDAALKSESEGLAKLMWHVPAQ
jgi:hypothetical protein